MGSARLRIFDSLAHPTLSAAWPGRDADAGFGRLRRDLRMNGFSGACAVGIHGLEGYDHRRFIEACRGAPELYPVAGFPLSLKGSVRREAGRIARMGFGAIKLHPRSAGVWPGAARLSAILAAAHREDLTVFLCTFQFGALEQLPVSDPFYALSSALQKAPGARVVLLHGGGPDLLRHAELVRSSANLMLDVSFTMMRYRGSSIDSDIRFAFRHLPDRVCVGSDHPEYDHAAVRRRFLELTRGLGPDHKARIAERNLRSFLRIDRA